MLLEVGVWGLICPYDFLFIYLFFCCCCSKILWFMHKSVWDWHLLLANYNKKKIWLLPILSENVMTFQFKGWLKKKKVTKCEISVLKEYHNFKETHFTHSKILILNTSLWCYCALFKKEFLSSEKFWMYQLSKVQISVLIQISILHFKWWVLCSMVTRWYVHWWWRINSLSGQITWFTF